MPRDISRCPQCNRLVQIPPELYGQYVQCPGCNSTFTAGETKPSPTPAPPPPNEYAPEPRREPPRYEGDRYDEDRDYRRRDYGTVNDARAAISGPATALQVVGGICLVICILGLMGNICALSLNANRPPGINRQGPLEEQISPVFGIGGGILGIIWGALLVNGGGKMKRLENYNSSRTAAILAILPCCCFAGTPFGIWALTVLNKPEVREAFRG